MELISRIASMNESFIAAMNKTSMLCAHYGLGYVTYYVGSGI